jgi:peptide/nickel transport system substrate-binding protein
MGMRQWKLFFGFFLGLILMLGLGTWLPTQGEEMDPRLKAIVDELQIPLYAPPAATTPPRQGGTLRIRTMEPKSFDIHQYVSYRLRIVNSYTHERLTQFKVGPGTSPVEHIPVPSLAQSWDIKDGGKTVIYHIRKGVKWHNKPPVNGRELKASDFVFTLDRIKRTEQAVYMNNILKNVESYEAPDDYTLVFHLKAPFAAFVYHMTRTGFEVLAPEVEKYCGDYVKPECAQIGTGPWMFESYTPGSNIVLKRNPDYWNQPYPYIDRLVLVFMDDEKAQDAAFRTGKLDLIGVETDAINGERFRSLRRSNPEMVYQVFVDPFNRRALWLKSDRPPFNDVRLRRAASMAIDRVGWVKSVMGGYGIPFGGWLYPGNAYWLPDDEYGACAQYLQYHPAEAKRLIQEAGYGPGGQPLQVTLQSTRGYGEEMASEAELVAAALQAVGIEVRISMVDYNSFIPVWRDGKYEHLAYTFLGYGYDADDWLREPFHSRFNGTRYFGYHDTTFDTLLDAQARELDPKKRIQLAQEAAKHLVCQAYAIAAPARLYFLGINPRLKNYLYHDSFDNGHPLMMSWIEE